jgi:hypothetical protein
MESLEGAVFDDMWLTTSRASDWGGGGNPAVGWLLQVRIAGDSKSTDTAFCVGYKPDKR